MAGRRKPERRRGRPRGRGTARRPAGSGARSAAPAPASAPAAAGAREGRPSPAPPLLRGVSLRDALSAAAIAVLAAVSYVPALSGGFVWDDVIFAEEPVIHAVSGLKSIWFSPADIRNEGHYWPLVYSSFWLEHKLWGLAPAGYHAVNILLHLVNCLLLWRLLARLRVPGAAVIAAVFAAHPVHVESVAWIIERKDVLSALFYLAAVMVWVRFAETSGAGRYALALLLFAAGLLSKSVVVTLPVALLIWHWWQQARVTRIDLLRLAPFVAVGLAITLADLSFYQSREPLELGYTLAERALIASRALWFYVGKLLWPVDLAVIYPLWEIDAGELLAWAYLVAAAALAAGLWLARHRVGRGPLAGVVYFAVTLGPVLGFVDFGYMQFSFVADRFQYLAGIGVLAVLIGGAAHGVGRLPEGYRRGALVLAGVVVVVLGALTWRQAGVYRDEVTLFSHVVAHNPQARDAHLNLANALIEAGRNEEGLAASRIAAEQRPDSADAHSNLGLALMNLQRFDAADEALGRARELAPNHQSALQNTGELLRKQGRHEEAVEAYRAVLERAPRYALAYAGMGDALLKLRRHEEAIAALRTALEIQPGLSFAADLYVLMGRAARELGRLDAAGAHLRRALELSPDKPAALLDLSGVLAAQQRREEADALLRRARELRGGDAATLQNVAEALRKQGRHEEALATYREVLDLDPDFALAHAGMGDALFRLGRHEEALEALRRALAEQSDVLMAATLHHLAGQAAQALDRVEDAAGHYANAVRIDPRDSASLDRLAMIRFGQERYQAALDRYRALLVLDPANAQVHSNLGATLYYLGRTEEALRSFERALEIEPELETARTGLAQLRAVTGE